MLIADHARKDAPAGSFSWKFITESVENSARQIEDKYRIGPDPNEPRPVAGGGLTRGGRVPFTHADDAELAQWVLSRPNVSRLGNELYQELERKVRTYILGALSLILEVFLTHWGKNYHRTNDIHGSHGGIAGQKVCSIVLIMS